MPNKMLLKWNDRGAEKSKKKKLQNFLNNVNKNDIIAEKCPMHSKMFMGDSREVKITSECQ